MYSHVNQSSWNYNLLKELQPIICLRSFEKKISECLNSHVEISVKGLIRVTTFLRSDLRSENSKIRLVTVGVGLGLNLTRPCSLSVLAHGYFERTSEIKGWISTRFLDRPRQFSQLFLGFLIFLIQDLAIQPWFHRAICIKAFIKLCLIILDHRQVLFRFPPVHMQTPSPGFYPFWYRCSLDIESVQEPSLSCLCGGCFHLSINAHNQ